MPYMYSERRAIQTKMFGCIEEDIDAAVQGSLSQNGLEVALSMLSDAQYLIMRDRKDQARQAINRAKYLIDKAYQTERERVYIPCFTCDGPCKGHDSPI